MNVNVFQTFQFGLITKKGEIIHIKFSLLLPRKRSGFKWKGTQLIQIGESKMADGSSIVKGHWCFSQLLDFTRQLTIKVIYRFMDSLREIWNLPTTIWRQIVVQLHQCTPFNIIIITIIIIMIIRLSLFFIICQCYRYSYFIFHYIYFLYYTLFILFHCFYIICLFIICNKI